MTITIARSSNPFIDRYVFDCKACTYANGWAQLDTAQDASYYGNWVSPSERKIVTYCEGDITVTKCDDDAEFAFTVREVCDWHNLHGHGPALIDAVSTPALKAAFEALGLGDLLH